MADISKYIEEAELNKDVARKIEWLINEDALPETEYSKATYFAILATYQQNKAIIEQNNEMIELLKNNKK